MQEGPHWITKEKIMKVDPEMDLRTMCRWSFAHGLFTREALAQLIASYIDQILKTRVDIRPSRKR